MSVFISNVHRYDVTSTGAPAADQGVDACRGPGGPLLPSAPAIRFPGMRSTEVRAIGELAGRTLAGAGTMVRDLHMAVSGRAFTAVGPGGAPARVVHDGVAEALYGGVRTALAALPRGAGAAIARSALDDAPALAQSARGSLALAALNAYVGDALVAGDSPLALAMTLRHRGADLPLEPEALADALPDAGARVAIFVHGLGETDASWRLRADAQRPGYGACLRRDLGHTPIELRYNTGLHISDNGRALAALLERAARGLARGDRGDRHRRALDGRARRAQRLPLRQPRGPRVDERRAPRLLPGLAAPRRSAGEGRQRAGLGAAPRARDATAGQPARACAARGSRTCATGRASRRTGATATPTSCSRDRCHDVPFLPGARFYFVAATLSRRPGDPLGAILGDLLVRVPSAAGEGRRRKVGFAIEDGHHVGGVTHFDLLNHPAVYDQIRAWIER